MGNFESIQKRESGLDRRITGRQLSMIALGGAIGTGLFLGSKSAIGFAGPSVILSYAIGGIVALLLMASLSEMTVAHTTSGSFGAYAEHYVSPLAGYLVRYMYWSCIVLAVGTEVTAVGNYMQLWFPHVPPVIWVVVFAGALVAVNAFNVKAFGTVEYWFSAVKVFAIIAFIILAVWLVLTSHRAGVGFGNYTAGGGFFPHGFSGTWIGVVVSIFSYLSVEMIAVAAAETPSPGTAVKKAFKVTFVRLFVFYIATLGLIVAIAPVSKILAGESPFVTVMQASSIPLAGSILNFVVIIAALSAMNSQLYISTRMMFSLSRGGDAPAVFGRVRPTGAPVNALILSTAGIAVAAVLYVLAPETAFTTMMALSMFGAMFTWMMIFVSHLGFRRSAAHARTALGFRVPFSRIGSVVGAVMMVALMVTTLFTDAFRMTLVFGVPFLVIVGAFYFVVRRHWRATAPQVGSVIDAKAD